MLLQALKIARPVHWTKNFSLFAALVFSGLLFSFTSFERVVLAFISFSLISSSIYIFNDIRDVELDQMHPIKKNRPLASGKLTRNVALMEMLALVTVSLGIASTLPPLFMVSVITYFILQIIYSLFLKNLPTIDIIIIATGFIIRVYAGAFVIDAHLSVWFLLCVISVALFLASGKRRAELNIIDQTTGVTRKSLSKYQRELLNSYVTMFGNSAWLAWALFTFYESPEAPLRVWLFLAELSRTTTISKLLMITIPVVIFAIMRYQSLIFEGKSEAPESLLLKDKPLVASVLVWTSLVIWILYFAGRGIPTI